MADILRSTARVPGFHAGMRLWLVEQSPVLRARQQAALAGAAPNWADTVDGLPDDAPLFLVANEFFDALPIRQFVASAGGWRERMVGLSGGALSFGLSPEVRLPVLDGRFADVAKGTLVELALPSEAAATAIGARIAAHGGAALVVDYGDWDGTGDTLQAVRAHGFADPLADPGSADLTAHVAFRWLAEAAAPLHPRLATQGQFLTALGIVARAERLAAAQPDAAGQIKDALRRLTHDAEMGRVFKTLALTPQGATPPPGFAP